MDATSKPIDISNDPDFPVCPDCRRSVWEIVRDLFTLGSEDRLEVRCRECGSVWTAARPEGEKDWRLFSHRA